MQCQGTCACATKSLDGDVTGWTTRPRGHRSSRAVALTFVVLSLLSCRLKLQGYALANVAVLSLLLGPLATGMLFFTLMVGFVECTSLLRHY